MAVALLLAVQPPLSAADTAHARAIEPAGYVHKSWTVRDGAPPAVCAILQGPDGYLWLGTGTGLYRFDGVQFERFQPDRGQDVVTGNITALQFDRAGGLWIGSYDGGAAYLARGTLRAYTTRDGFPPGWVLDFAEGPDGETWVATGQGLARFDGAQWKQVGADWGYPTDRADWVMFDRTGTLWVAAVNQLMFLRRGSRHFEASGIALAPGATMALDRDGTVWVSDRLHGTRPLRGLSATPTHADMTASLPVTDAGAALRFMFDRSGGMWATGLGTGKVFHIKDPAEVSSHQMLTEALITDTFSAPDGLASDTAIAVTEDKEGNIWVGTALGIDSYHRSQVGGLREFGLQASPHASVTRDAMGALWLADGTRVYRMQGGKLVPVIADGPDALGILAGTDNIIWLLGFHDLFRLDPSGPTAVPLPSHVYSSRIKSIAAGPAGSLWASIEGLGIQRWHDGQWTAWVPSTRGLQGNPTVVAMGAEQSVWFGYNESELLRVDASGREQHFSRRTGLDIGTITAVTSDGDNVLFGGSAGLAVYHSGKLRSLNDRAFPTLTGITGIVQTDGGDIWVNSARGVTRITADELDHALSDGRYRPQLDTLDFRDGLIGTARQGQPVGSMQRDAMERIWFITNEAVHWIDPTQRVHNLTPPPVYIKSVEADGRTYKPTDHMTLKAGNQSLQIDYTAASLTSPSRTRFRYRLVGEDKAWVDPGTRRRAYYTTVPPGAYRFDVVASNEDGPWTPSAASIEIVVPPLFRQTVWFYLIIAALAFIVLASAFFYRLRQVAKNINLQSEARHQERERIARELHDTLLQAVYGIMLRFQAVAAAIAADDPVQKSLRSTLKMASDFIIEGRNRVKDLRTHVSSIRELAAAITELAAGVEQASSVPIQTEIDAVDHPVDAAVGDDVLAICRESLVNALRHADATRVILRVTACDRTLHVTITDNGKGMDASTYGNPQQTGHWGIAGMRERALIIGGTLNIDSTTRGTSVRLVVPLRASRRSHPTAPSRDMH